MIFLFSKKQTWAKWLLSISLVLYGILCLQVGFELMAAFYLIGIYNIFFGIFIHTSKMLSVFREQAVKRDPNVLDFVPEGVEGHHIERSHQYPLLVRRFKALLIDGALVTFTLIIIMVVLQGSDFRIPIMISSALILTLTYEPFLTSYSRTVGQRLMGIKVGRHEDPGQRISLLNAYVRWFVKSFLGWVSFLTIHSNPERRAIHDLASGSVMIMEE